MKPVLHFIEPIDVLILRGNKLFGDPGSFGESLVPPWPSAASGAIRSALLVDRSYDLQKFSRGAISSDTELGTPTQPGTFALSRFQLARRDSQGLIEPIHAMPADLVCGRTSGDQLSISMAKPQTLSPQIESSKRTCELPILAESQRTKKLSGLWLTDKGWARYLKGECPDPRQHIVQTHQLWQLETRTGVGLNADKRSAEEGQLFTVQAASFLKREHGADYDIGFITEVMGASIPEQLSLRFGGDGRGALAKRITQEGFATPNYAQIASQKRCKLILTTPGLFDHGWLPTGCEQVGQKINFSLHGVEGTLISAAVPRSEIISGYDIAQRKPKPAEAVVSTGAVYWLELHNTTEQALKDLVSRGLWDNNNKHLSRRAEGFNRLTIAAY